MQLPGPIRATVGLFAAAADEAKHLPDRAIELPMLAVSSALQVSLRAQQRYARLTARGDQALNRSTPSAEPPVWATFDEPISIEELRQLTQADVAAPDRRERPDRTAEAPVDGNFAAAATSADATPAQTTPADTARGNPAGPARETTLASESRSTAPKRSAAKGAAKKAAGTTPARTTTAAKKTAAKKTVGTGASGRRASAARTGRSSAKSVSAPRTGAPSRFDAVGDPSSPPPGSASEPSDGPATGHS